MKKILVLLLAVTMLLGMVACAQNAEAPAETKDTETTAPTETTQNSATSDAETNESEDNAQAAGRRIWQSCRLQHHGRCGVRTLCRLFP